MGGIASVLVSAEGCLLPFLKCKSGLFFGVKIGPQFDRLRNYVDIFFIYKYIYIYISDLYLVTGKNHYP